MRTQLSVKIFVSVTPVPTMLFIFTCNSRTDGKCSSSSSLLAVVLFLFLEVTPEMLLEKGYLRCFEALKSLTHVQYKLANILG